MEAEKEIELLLGERDRHIRQLMDINAKASFAGIAITLSVLIGLGDLTDSSLSGTTIVIVAVGVFTSVISLCVATYRFAKFHLAAIRDLEESIQGVFSKHQISSQLQIMPSKEGNFVSTIVLAGFGVISLVVTGMVALIVALL